MSKRRAHAIRTNHLADDLVVSVLQEELDAHIDAFTSKIVEEAAAKPEVRLLMGFTGIDYYSAMLLASEIGDVTRFPSAKKLVGYAGLAPGIRQLRGGVARNCIRWDTSTSRAQTFR